MTKTTNGPTGWYANVFKHWPTKLVGAQPTAAQLEEHKAMMDKGLAVHVIDDIDTFKSLFGQWEKEIADFRLVDKMMGDPTCSQSK